MRGLLISCRLEEMATTYNDSLCLKVSSRQGRVVDWTAAVRMRGAPLVHWSSADLPTRCGHDHALDLQLSTSTGSRIQAAWACAMSSSSGTEWAAP